MGKWVDHLGFCSVSWMYCRVLWAFLGFGTYLYHFATSSSLLTRCFSVILRGIEVNHCRMAMLLSPFIRYHHREVSEKEVIEVFVEILKSLCLLVFESYNLR